jgi:hypothetical protein
MSLIITFMFEPAKLQMNWASASGARNLRRERAEPADARSTLNVPIASRLPREHFRVRRLELLLRIAPAYAWPRRRGNVPTTTKGLQMQAFQWAILGSNQ